ncbi:MAG TPA: hypothetical protein VFW05_07475 [Verrucomicrobiae bacterium]|nr:hypothetical protein [Verrucomicrobiae bacterium]
MKSNTQVPQKRFFLWSALILAIVLGLLFWKSCLPGWVHFSNDGPLGVQNSAYTGLPAGLTGIWNDLNSIGFPGGAAAADFTTFVRWLLGPVGYAKFWPPIALFTLGLCAWTLFRQLKFEPIPCVLGALAVLLTSTFFSAACWGVASQEVAIGMDFLALALVLSAEKSTSTGIRLSKWILAGCAIGMSIMEGFDNGAIFSLLIAAFVVYRSLISPTGSLAKRVAKGVGRTALIAICAAVVAAHMIAALVETQIKGVSGTQQDERTKLEQWDWATQWSLPKGETLNLIVSGLFGYRMDTPDGGNYWGAIGRDPAWDRYFAGGRQGQPPAGPIRFTGGGSYLGVPVALIALWTIFQAFRRNHSPFSLEERRTLWFWIAVSGVALLLAFGRFAPFYRILYALPYFSTIRNPIKFIAIFNFAILILFTYGVHTLWRSYVLPARLPVTKDLFERRWLAGCVAAIGVSLIGWILYASFRRPLEEYIQSVQFSEAMAHEMAGFSIRQVGWFVLFLILSVGLMWAILKGKFAGAKTKALGIALGIVLVADLGRANRPWIVFVDYKQKYQSNPIVDLLRDKPYEHRVAILPFRFPPEFSLFDQLYRIEWAQHHFPYYNIQSLDVVQMPRVAQDLQNFESAIQYRGDSEHTYLPARRWTLTNTRYLLGPAGYLETLNQELDPAQRRFRIVTTFRVMPKAGIENPTKLEELTAEPAPNGPYALFEFTGALPRVKLYSQWEVPARNAETMAKLQATTLSTNEMSYLHSVGTNDYLTLHKLAARDFDPHQLVLLADAPDVPNSTTTNQNAGTVQYVSYAPKDIHLQADASTPAVLLLNDKYDSNWRVYVDGKRSDLLRCNYIMRGVYLTPGRHEVEFKYEPDTRPMYVTLTALVIAGVLIGFVAFGSRRNSDQTA